MESLLYFRTQVLLGNQRHFPNSKILTGGDYISKSKTTREGPGKHIKLLLRNQIILSVFHK